MKLKEQVVSLELAKRLRELGVKQISLFNWYQKHDDSWHIDECDLHNVQYSAFTVAELGEILAKFGIKEFPFIEFYTHENAECWKFKNPHTEYREEKIVLDKVSDSCEADARAKMIIYFIEKGIVKP